MMEEPYIQSALWLKLRSNSTVPTFKELIMQCEETGN
jgi:hypothetical protein